MSLLLKLAPYLIMLVMAAGAWLVIDRKCWTTACKDEARRADTAELLIKAAQERATALALLWAKSIEHVEVRYVEVEKVRVVRFETIRERVGKIEMAACPITNDAAQLLRDISAAANAAGAAAAPGPSPAPEAAVPAPAGWVAYAAAAAESFRERDDARLECISQYNIVRDGIIKAQETP